MLRVCAGFVVIALAACGPTGNQGQGDGGNHHLTDASVGVDRQIIFWDAQGPDGVVGCNPKDFTLQQEPPPEVMLVIDRSGSMLELGTTGNTKWVETNNAITAVVAQFESTIQFGLLMYPAGDQCLTPPPQVGIGLDHLEPISQTLLNTIPAGGTPTAGALRYAGLALEGRGTVEPKFVVLATDGGPNCNYFNSLPCGCTLTDQNYCCTSYPDACVSGQFCLDEVDVLDVIDELNVQQGITTFVIGLDGSQEYVELLNSMALAGGQPQVGGSTDYYSATSQTELAAALQAITGSVISCTIPLDEAPDLPDGVRIFFDGSRIPRDTGRTNGWDYSNPELTEITLYGSYCAGLQDGTEHTVTATFACEVN